PGPAAQEPGAAHGDHSCAPATAPAATVSAPLPVAPLPLLWALARAAHTPAPPAEDAPAAPRHGYGLLTLLCVHRV
ncbi:hypothetical protein ACFVWN_31970, partial [Nocardiopsis flavescens]